MFVSSRVSLLMIARIVLSFFSAVAYGRASSDDLFARTPVSGIDVNSLAPYLSSSTRIYLPGSSEFTAYTTRWSNLEPPTPNVVIVPGNEKDVAKIVRTELLLQHVVCQRSSH
jgi:hypothetical protein